MRTAGAAGAACAADAAGAAVLAAGAAEAGVFLSPRSIALNACTRAQGPAAFQKVVPLPPRLNRAKAHPPYKIFNLLLLRGQYERISAA